MRDTALVTGAAAEDGRIRVERVEPDALQTRVLLHLRCRRVALETPQLEHLAQGSHCRAAGTRDPRVTSCPPEFTASEDTRGEGRNRYRRRHWWEAAAALTTAGLARRPERRRRRRGARREATRWRRKREVAERP